ncbi:MAG: hypothetical protein HQ536_00765, partial [Parcubacteria group bacterium]|nr:hypothetical protein [Parcubacteria group bacterium]
MEPYKSKDYIIDGSYLLLDKDKAWEQINKRMRTAIKKAETFSPRVEEVSGSEEYIQKFYKFCPCPDTLPKKIAENQKMFFCFLDNEIVGGLILTEIAGNLFLQFNAVTELGRERQISSYLLWEMVKIFTNSKYKYLDVGASYRESLQKYFTGWQTKRYPLLMKPPEIKPQINITSFDSRFLSVPNGDLMILDERLENKWQGREYTFFPRGMHAISSLIKWFVLEGKMNEDDEVCIKTTGGSKYISGCVTSAIEQTCKWSQEINERTKAIFVIHEFGFPHPEIKKFRM